MGLCYPNGWRRLLAGRGRPFYLADKASEVRAIWGPSISMSYGGKSWSNRRIFHRPRL